MAPLRFNKLCEFEDFRDPEMVAIIRDVCSHKAAYFPPSFPEGLEHRKDWEVAMAVRSFEHFGILRRDATILGVAAGTEDTLFYLTRRVGQVFATDRYLVPGDWQPLAPPLMLIEPEAIAPYDFEPNRLVVQHMDGRWLRYPDGTFDGVFSSGSIEHFGQLQDAAYSAFEMGRVLKPGGILSLTTEFRLTGPPEGIGWPGLTLLFSKQNLLHYIVEASGLELVDEPEFSVSDATLAVPRNLSQVVQEHLALGQAQKTATDPLPDFTLWDFPHLVMAHEDYLFGSVNLTLRKSAAYPLVDNSWAKPPASVLADISRHNRQGELAPPAAAAAPPADAPPANPATPPAAQPGPATPRPGTVAAHRAAIQELSRQIAEILAGIDASREVVEEAMASLDALEGPIRTRTEQPDVAGLGVQPDPASWLARQVALPDGTAFTVVVDADATDHVSRALAAGVAFEQSLVTLMLQLVSPGDLVLDLGAHVGMFSLAAAAAGCRVIAVEGSPVNAALLRRAAWRNGFHQLRVVNAVVSDRPGEVAFVADGPWGHVAWDQEDASGTPNLVSIPAVTVDELLAEFGGGEVAFLKMDVEGSEVKAIQGMRRLLGDPKAPPVLFESNGHTLAFAGTAASELLLAFEGLGYTNYLVDPGQLTRIAADQPQPVTVADCLAVKRRPKGLHGWLVVPRLTEEALVAKIAAEARHDNHDCRAYAARTMAALTPALQSSPEITTALAALRADASADVQAAAAWSASDNLSEPRGATTDRTEANTP